MKISVRSTIRQPPFLQSSNKKRSHEPTQAGAICQLPGHVELTLVEIFTLAAKGITLRSFGEAPISRPIWDIFQANASMIADKPDERMIEICLLGSATLLKIVLTHCLGLCNWPLFTGWPPFC